MAGCEEDRVCCRSEGSGGSDVLVEGKKSAGRREETCMPWQGSRCRVYHEHAETETCAHVFMGH
jgi:hypothetical protein